MNTYEDLSLWNKDSGRGLVDESAPKLPESDFERVERESHANDKDFMKKAMEAVEKYFEGKK